MIFSPVRLHQDAVDLVDADDLFAIPDGFEHGGDAEVAGTPEKALRRAYNEGDGVITEGIMTHADGVALGIKEGLHVLRIQAGHFYQQQSIKQGLVEMTISGQPKSRLQKYRLTDRGQSVLAGSQKCV